MTVADVKARVQDILSRNFEVGLWGDRGFFVETYRRSDFMALPFRENRCASAIASSPMSRSCRPAA